MELIFNETYREYVYIVLPYIKKKKKSKEAWRIDNFQAFATKLSFLPTKLDIFYIRQHYVCILFIFQ